MRIGVDVDGVLADQVRAVVLLLNAVQEQHYSYLDVKHWGGLQELYKISESELLRHMETAWAQHQVGWLIDPKELQGLLHRLHRKSHTVHIVSKRTPKSWPYVMGWLGAQSLPLDSVHFLASGSKYDMPIDIMLDDSPKLALEAEQRHKPLLLIDQPWNQDAQESPYVRRAADVGAGLETFLEEYE